MIIDSGKYYLYRHIRLDKNVPFYVGIGKKYNNTRLYSREYRRAFGSNEKRSNYWKRIVNTTDYRVEIMLESDNLEFIKQKEIEFIKLYGRKNEENGSLCNLTDGGDGCVNFKFTNEQINNLIDIKSKGGKHVILMTLTGDFIMRFRTLSQCSKYLQTSASNVRIVCKSVRNSKSGEVDKSVKNRLVCYKEDYSKFNYFFDKTLSVKKMVKKLQNHYLTLEKPVYQYDKFGNFIKKFDSGTKADRELELPLNSCSTIAARNDRNEYLSTTHSYYWFYRKVNFNNTIRIKRKNGVISLKLNE